MPFRLTVRIDDDVVNFGLRLGENLIGSDPSCEVVLDDPTVSRHHASLVVVTTDQGDAIELADLGSLNGTWIERVRIEGKGGLGHGSRVRFGSVEGQIQEVSAADAVAYSGSDADMAAPLPTPPAEDDKPAAPSAGTTAEVGPLSIFTLGQLPSLLGALVEREPTHAVAARAGSVLAGTLPLSFLRIGKRVGERLVAWYEVGDGDESERAPDCAERSGDVEIEARFESSESQRLFAPILTVVARLLAVSAQRAGRERKPSITAAAHQAEPPDPPTLEASVATLYRRAEQVASGEINVLIQGESGTGKELLARFLHAASPRREGPFVALNCAALPRDLQETELFGIEQGVATGVSARPGKFEQADGGTLFLDEIGDMAPEVQAKILRVLQEGEVFRLGSQAPRSARTRVVSATHRDLRTMVDDGGFRSDLFHRIADWSATVPPLRQRRLDIPNLVHFFVQQQAAQADQEPVAVSQAAMDALVAHHWPGNVRQLEREIARARLFVPVGGMLDSGCLSEEILEAGDGESGETLRDRVAAAERRIIRSTLASVDGDVPAASRTLDVPLSTLYRKIKSYDLSS